MIESATFEISFSLCEIRMQAMPCDLSSSSSFSSASLSVSFQARGRLVEDQQLDLLRQRLRDLDQLLLADADVGHQRRRRFLEADLLQQHLRLGERAEPVDDTEARALVAEEDVLGDRQQGGRARVPGG